MPSLYVRSPLTSGLIAKKPPVHKNSFSSEYCDAARAGQLVYTLFAATDHDLQCANLINARGAVTTVALAIGSEGRMFIRGCVTEMKAVFIVL
jgi:hypothetical protein